MDLYKYVGILLLIDILAMLYMLFAHCNLGADTYGWKWDTKRNEIVVLGLMISCIVLVGTLVMMERIGI